MKMLPRTAGLTLVEVVVASVLTVLVTGGTVGILRSTTAARGRVDRQAELQQEAYGAAGRMATALRNASRSPDEGWILEGIRGWDGEQPSDRIRFFTVSRGAVRRGEPESDVRECEFFLARPNVGQLPVLMRRFDPTRNDDPDGGGVLEPIALHVVGLAMEYHDGSAWMDHWPADQRTWPGAVRIRLMVGDEQAPSVTWPVTMLVNFPYRPAPPQADSSAGTAGPGSASGSAGRPGGGTSAGPSGPGGPP